MSPYGPIYDQAAREFEEEPEAEPRVCDECGQRKCVCAKLDGFDKE